MDKQRKSLRDDILDFVACFVDDNGYAPTYDEIREAVGLSSKSHVDYYLQALEEDGLIERTPRTPRALRLVRLHPTTLRVRVEGIIAAGRPVELADNLGRQIEITPDIADPRKDLFALRVQGDSMVDDLVGDGDILIVERRQEASRGQMAVIHLRERNETTLKRIYPEGELVRLQPAHPTLQPFYARARDVQVQGRVVAIIRQL